MTLPHESKEGGSTGGESKETAPEPEDAKVEQATDGDLKADDQGHAAQPADEQGE